MWTQKGESAFQNSLQMLDIFIESTVDFAQLVNPLNRMNHGRVVASAKLSADLR